MAEAVSGKMIVLHFDNELRRDRFPFAAALRAPAAGAARGGARKTRRFNQGFQAFRQSGLFGRRQSGGKANMIEQSGIVVKPQQQRSDQSLFRAVAKAANHAIRGPKILDLQHGFAFAGSIGPVDTLGDHAIERSCHSFEPRLCHVEIASTGREPDAILTARNIYLRIASSSLRRWSRVWE